MTPSRSGFLRQAWGRLSYLWRYQIIFWGIYSVVLFPVHFIGLRYVFGWDAPFSSIILIRILDNIVMVLLTQVFGLSLESRLYQRLGIAASALWIFTGSLVIVTIKSFLVFTHLLLPLYDFLGDFHRTVPRNEISIAQYSYSILQYAAWGGIFVFSKRAHEAKQKEKELRLAEAKRREAEILMLRSQLNPHFLFNALNTLAAESGQISGADRLVECMSGYLRYSLANRHQLFVPMSEEIQATESYIEVEARRFGDGLTYRIHAAPSCLQVPVPGILLQPLVENAILHGRRADGTLHIDLRCRYAENLLRITLRSPGPWISRKEDASLDNLSRLKERLNLLYPGRADLEVRAADGWTTVEVRIRDPLLGGNSPNSPAVLPSAPTPPSPLPGHDLPSGIA